MAESFQFDLVSPEGKLASLQARSVQVPGMEGDLTAMPDHAPFITTLRPGVVRVASDGGDAEYVVTGGFAEISQKAASVLAEQALPRGEVGAEFLASVQEAAESELAEAPEEAKRAAAQRVRDVAMLRSQLGL